MTKPVYTYTFMTLRKKMKAVLASLAILVGFAFVFGYSVVGKSGDSDGRNQKPIGTLLAEPVLPHHLAQARRNTFIAQQRDALYTRRRAPRLTPRERDRSAWGRLAASRYALNLGLITGNDERDQAIRAEFTAEDGSFRSATYAEFLKLLGLRNETYYQDFIEEDRTIDKLRKTLEAASLLTPFEVDRNTRRVTDIFKVTYVTLTTNQLTDDVEVTADDLLEVYDNQRQLFREPERLRVKYVAFSISNHLAEVSVSADDIKLYYEERKDDDYSFNNTNAFETIYTPLADVEDEISGILKKIAATEITVTGAWAMSEAAIDEQVSSEPFQQIATQMGKTVRTTEYFSATEDVASIDAPPDFAKEAFKLTRGETIASVSYPISGPNHVFVISIDDRKAPYVPDFDTIYDDVQLLALEQKRDEAFTERAEEIRDAIKSELKQGAVFTNCLAAHRLEPIIIDALSWNQSPTNMVFPFNMRFLQQVTDRETGELAGPIAWTNGTLLLAHVADRAKGEPHFVQSISWEIAQNLSRDRAARLLHDLQQRIMSNDNVDAMLPAEESDTDLLASPTNAVEISANL